MINLGLNRKISNVLSKNLNDPESDIYKEISSIAGETTESDSDIIKVVENGKDTIIRFYDSELTEIIENAFDDFYNLEELYLPNVTRIRRYESTYDYFSYPQTLRICLNCSKLKKLMIPKAANSMECIWLDDMIANLPIKIMALKGNIENGGMFDSYPIFNSLETLILTTCSSIGYSGLDTDKFPNLNNLILLNKETYVHHAAWGTSTSFLSVYNNIYVPDTMVDIYISNGLAESYIKPLNQLPDNLKKELELCGIEI